ncbi:hypothetical protein L4C33_05985 [Vibrio makurazakiensis]|uniref:hypothetical protein n=1 Tax=Vibrio makurazakiensis TaxID=2910250 RepID=UPI003D0E89A1
MRKSVIESFKLKNSAVMYGYSSVKHLILLLLVTSSCSITWASEIWQSDMSYQVGDMVSHNEQVFVSTQWNKGNLPNPTGNHWQGWVLSSENIAQFEFGKHYASGELVYVNSELYLSKWGNTNERPDISWYWRKLSNHSSLDIREYTPQHHSNPKSREAILGQDSNRNSIKDAYEVAVFEQYKSEDLQRLALNMSYIYRALHQLELDESINLLEEEATDLFVSLFAWETCMEHLQVEKVRTSYDELKLPRSLYLDNIYSALFFRLGQNEAFRDLNGEFDFYDQNALESHCEYYDLETELIGNYHSI